MKRNLTPDERARFRVLVEDIRSDLREMRGKLEALADRADEPARAKQRRRRFPLKYLRRS